MEHSQRNGWYTSAVWIGGITAITGGILLLLVFFGNWHGFGSLMAAVLLIYSITGMAIGGSIGAVLGLVSWFKKERNNKTRNVIILNILLAALPVGITIISFAVRESHYQANQYKQTPTQQMFGLVNEAGLLHTQRKQEFLALLNKGGDIDALEGHDMTLFIKAIIYQHEVGIIDFFIQHGAKVNRVTASGWTPLHAAVAKGNPGMVRRLLSYGARTDIKTHEGQTALDRAIYLLGLSRSNNNEVRQYQEIIKILKEHN